MVNEATSLHMHSYAGNAVLICVTCVIVQSKLTDGSVEVAVTYRAVVDVGYTATCFRCDHVSLHLQMLHRSPIIDIFKEAPAGGLAGVGDGMSASVKVSFEREVAIPYTQVNVLIQTDITYLIINSQQIFLAIDLILRLQHLDSEVKTLIFIIIRRSLEVESHHAAATGQCAYVVRLALHAAIETDLIALVAQSLIVRHIIRIRAVIDTEIIVNKNRPAFCCRHTSRHLQSAPIGSKKCHIAFA